MQVDLTFRNLFCNVSEIASRIKGQEINTTTELIIEVIKGGPVDVFQLIESIKDAHVTEGVPCKV